MFPGLGSTDLAFGQCSKMTSVMRVHAMVNWDVLHGDWRRTLQSQQRTSAKAVTGSA
jgi:hypothetical protein